MDLSQFYGVVQWFSIKSTTTVTANAIPSRLLRVTVFNGVNKITSLISSSPTCSVKGFQSQERSRILQFFLTIKWLLRLFILLILRYCTWLKCLGYSVYVSASLNLWKQFLQKRKEAFLNDEKNANEYFGFLLEDSDVKINSIHGFYNYKTGTRPHESFAIFTQLLGGSFPRAKVSLFPVSTTNIHKLNWWQHSGHGDTS